MLRLRTEHSFGRAIGTIDECLDAWEASTDFRYVPLTDSGGLWGWWPFARACKARNLSPVYGAELDVAPSRWGYQAQRRHQRQQWLVFSRTQSVAPVNRLVERMLNRNKPKILTYEEALAEPDTVVIVGGAGTDFEVLDKAIKGRAKGVEVYAQLRPGLSADHVRQAYAIGLAFAACGENTMAFESQRDLLLAMIPEDELIGLAEPVTKLSDLHRDIDTKFAAVDFISGAQAIAVSRKILEQCAAAAPAAPVLPCHKDAKSFRALVWRAAEISKFDYTSAVYKRRLEYELDVICDKGLENYFLIIRDFCGQADGRWLIGPGRGSSAASLVCYVLGITHIDPVEHGLIFERFLNPERNDLPDIDIDIQHHKREDACEWLADRHQNVARLGAITTYGRASAFAQAAKSEGLNLVLSQLFSTPQDAWEAEKLPLKEFLATHKQAKTFTHWHPGLMIAADIEGRARHTTTHAAGVAINDGPLNEIAPVVAQTMQVTKDDTNLLKLDVLGVRGLSVIAETLQTVGKGVKWIRNIELDRAEAFEQLNGHRFAGVYQYQSTVNRRLALKIKVETFDDLVALGSIARPGPLESGQADLWLKRRAQPGMIATLKNSTSPISKITWPTLGVILYQEQVMQIAREIGGLSWAEVHDIRRFISSAKGRERIAVYRDRFVAGAVASGAYDRNNAQRLWSVLAAHGGYSFNRAHACAYALVAYWCLCLKAWWPLEYACAYLNHTQGKKQRAEMIDETRKHHGARVVHFDAKRSTLTWRVVDEWRGQGQALAGWPGKVLLGPLTNVVTIGEKTAEAIVGARARGERLDEKLRKKLQEAQSKTEVSQ